MHPFKQRRVHLQQLQGRHGKLKALIGHNRDCEHAFGLKDPVRNDQMQKKGQWLNILGWSVGKVGMRGIHIACIVHCVILFGQ